MVVHNCKNERAMVFNLEIVQHHNQFALKWVILFIPQYSHRICTGDTLIGLDFPFIGVSWYINAGFASPYLISRRSLAGSVLTYWTWGLGSVSRSDIKTKM